MLIRKRSWGLLCTRPPVGILKNKYLDVNSYQYRTTISVNTCNNLIFDNYINRVKIFPKFQLKAEILLDNQNEDIPATIFLCTGVYFQVFGLGNKTYEHYNKVAIYVDKRLEELGATRVFELGLGDDDAKYVLIRV